MEKSLEHSYIASKKRYNGGVAPSSEGAASLFENLPELIRPRELARVLGISLATIYDWRYRGKMRNVPVNLFLKINRNLFIRTEVLRSWISLQN